MIRLIVSDVDGTLVPDGSGVINPEYYDVISKLCDKGYTVCIASGRQYASIKRLFAPIADRLLFIAEGGGIVRSPKELFHVEAIPEELMDEFFTDCRGLSDFDFFAATPDVSYCESGTDSPMYRLLKDSYNFNIENVKSVDEVDHSQIVKISLYHETDAESACRDTIIAKWNSRLQTVCAGSHWVDCLSLKANKGNALARLQQILNISPEETLAFGDNMNDIPMFKQAGISYAVANAREEVRQAASAIADTHWNNGVLKELKKLL